ncbi:hypothetical protein INT44_001014 [Umbelopsis vinacea]|uniref:Uncharacterized protein n=1 Tax=Umbelopsis vinacea TaxID=44442 RepID=A0A8H7Q9G5_9FUNG|nr:hypothetical protein INT44_001014 [Umbelopsis vinacea]
MHSTTLGSSQPPLYNATVVDYEQRYLSLLRTIASLQWVRESLPAHTRYYESLKNKLKNEEITKNVLESSVQQSRKTNDSTRFKELMTTKKGGADIVPYSDLIERLQKSNNRILDLTEQLQQAKLMHDDMLANMEELNGCCSQLRVLFDQVIPEPLFDPAYTIEEHMKSEVLSLESYIPQIEGKLEKCVEAQTRLYEARDSMETAMKSLPGAASILERQAMINNVGVGRGGVRLGSLNVLLDMSVSSTRDAEGFAEKSVHLVKEAVDLYPDMPMIPDSPISQSDSVSEVLTTYRGYRLKIESLLRNFINPRVKLMQGDFAYAKHSHESKRMEWVEQQLLVLEAVLRAQGGLQDIDIDPDMAAIRMGSNAAAGSASELGGRVAVDDALDVVESNTSPARNGPLPEYHLEQETSTERQTSISAGPSRTAPTIENGNELPEYSRGSRQVNEWPTATVPAIILNSVAEPDNHHDQPPAYTD